MTPYHRLLGVASDATPAELEAAYARKQAEYTLPDDAPGDLQHLATQQLAALESARAQYQETTPPRVAARSPFLTRREWLWTGGGVLLACIVLGIIALVTRGVNTNVGLVALDRPVPDLTLPTLDGGSVALSDLRGKVVLINFWATWCEPCKAETPDLVAAYAEFKDAGLEIIGINLTDQEPEPDEIRRFVQRYQVNYPIALDRDQAAQRAFGIFPIPVSYFVDSNGRVRYTRNSVVTRNDIERVLDELRP